MILSEDGSTAEPEDWHVVVFDKPKLRALDLML